MSCRYAIRLPNMSREGDGKIILRSLEIAHSVYVVEIVDFSEVSTKLPFNFRFIRLAGGRMIVTVQNKLTPSILEQSTQ